MPATAATINQQLTNYAAGVAQDRASALARFVAPLGAHGDRPRAIQTVQRQERLPGARHLAGHRRHAQADRVRRDGPVLQLPAPGPGDHHRRPERALAGDSGIGRMQEAKIRNLVGACSALAQKKVFDVLKAGLAATGAIGVGATPATTPWPTSTARSRASPSPPGACPTGSSSGWARGACPQPRQGHGPPARRRAGRTHRRAGRPHDAESRHRRARGGSLLRHDQVQAKSASNIVGGEVFIFYAPDAPDQYDPSFMKKCVLDLRRPDRRRARIPCRQRRIQRLLRRLERGRQDRRRRLRPPHHAKLRPNPEK